MELTYECPQCQAVGRLASIENVAEAACPRCDYARPLTSGAIESGQLLACPWCATEDLYLQKDFPHGLGLGIVVVGFAISSAFWYYYMPIAALATLLATAALDIVLYYLVPDVTICYRCLSQYRGPGTDGGGRLAPFDLAVGERYRQEKLRVEELRKRAAGRGEDAGW